MEFELKGLSKESIPRALDRAETYRLLNQPEQAESICRDILRVDADHEQALIMLLLALTDQFGEALAERFNRARSIIERFKDEYQVRYYSGIVFERRARAQLARGLPGSSEAAYEWFRRAMEEYEKSEDLRPSGNDESILRWNSCARTIMDLNLEASPEDSFQPFLE